MPQLVAEGAFRSGTGLRRAIHTSDLQLADIASKVGITPIMLDEFLTGERTLRSDVMDRLATVLGLRLQRVS